MSVIGATSNSHRKRILLVGKTWPRVPNSLTHVMSISYRVSKGQQQHQVHQEINISTFIDDFTMFFPAKSQLWQLGFNLPQFMDGLNGFNGLELIQQMFCHRIRCCKEHETTHHLSQPWQFWLQTTACSLLVPENPLFFLDPWASFCKTISKLWVWRSVIFRRWFFFWSSSHHIPIIFHGDHNLVAPGGTIPPSQTFAKGLQTAERQSRPENRKVELVFFCWKTYDFPIFPQTVDICWWIYNLWIFL